VSPELADEQDGVTEAAIHKYMDLLQANIQRMSALSNGCKTWCVTLTAALLVLGLQDKVPAVFYVLLLPVAMFYFLDCYYLTVERRFVGLFKEFADKARVAQVRQSDLYVMDIRQGLRSRLALILRIALLSFATLPFYAIVLLAVFLALCFAK
jgi:hypothetical protein